MSEYTVKDLTPETWEGFAALGGKHNGVWGGCWCLTFHPEDKPGTFDGNRDLKQHLVEVGVAHAALVYDGETCVGWCEYGTPAQLPRIYYRKQVESASDALPDHRITCFFVDRDHRRRGVSALALRGALDLIAEAGGGLVESYPQETAPGEKVNASFLFNGTRRLFEQAGFTYVRPAGKRHCVMRLQVVPRA